MNTDVIRQALELAKASQPHVSPVTGEENALVGIIDQALTALDAMQSVDLEKLKREAHNDYVIYACGNADQCCFESVSWTIDHLHSIGLLGIPEGYALVPVEPTEAMDIAGAIAAEYEKPKASRLRAYDCYRAMIAAAPQGETR